MASPRNRIIVVIGVVLVVAGAIGGFITWQILGSRIYIEDAQILAPVTTLTPQVGGTLEEVYVNVGDQVEQNAPIARVGDELIKANAAGEVISVATDIGSTYGPGSTVATMIDPSDLRVVGQVEEDKGLRYIKIGQPAIFTVDAFGSQEFSGVVDEVSPTARAGDVVFNISDKRQEQNFDVKVRFSATLNPQLQNGMSAKLWIYKK